MAVANVPTRLAFQTLLVATNFSAPSKAALAYASVIARKSQGKVLVAHVISPERWPTSPEDLHPALCQTRRMVQKKMAMLLKYPPLSGVDVEAIFREGELRHVLCEIVRSHCADLLIVNTRGSKGLKKLLLGSRVESVCHVAPCPILLVGPKASGSPASFERILFPTDLSPVSLGALPTVLALAAQHRATLRFVRICRSIEDADLNLSEMQDEIGPALTERAGLSKPPEYSVEIGEPAEAVLGAAREWRSDLIAMGAHRPGTLATHLPGDIVYDVVCDAPCPVLTISD